MAEKATAAKAASETRGQGSEPRVQGKPAGMKGEPALTGSKDAGPGTGREAPPETGPVYQTRVGVTGAPIEAPDFVKQEQPEEGLSRSSTNAVTANAVLRTMTGENHVRLLGKDGNEVDPSNLFEPADETRTYRVVAESVTEEFTYPGSVSPMQRLLYAKGQHVTLAQAAGLADAAKNAKKQYEQEQERVAAEERGDSAKVAEMAGGERRS